MSPTTRNRKFKENTTALMILRLGDRSADIRDSASENLIKIGKPVVNELLEELDQAEDVVRCGIIDVLGEIGDEKAAGPLLEILANRNESSMIRYTAIEALGGISCKEVLDLLIATFLDEHEGELVRKVARRTAYIMKEQAIDCSQIRARDLL